jgi:hypothetical protein
MIVLRGTLGQMLQTLSAPDVYVARTSRQLVLIAAGTPVTCELGHPVCVTASDIRADEPLAVEMFTRWQHPPQSDGAFPPCSLCGGAAHREGPDGLELHTPEGWRSLKGTATSTIATSADIENAVALLNAKIEAMTRLLEAALWKHTLGIILNVLVIGGLLIWFIR